MAENNKETENKQTIPDAENVTETVAKTDAADLTKRNAEYLFKLKKVLEEKMFQVKELKKLCNR